MRKQKCFCPSFPTRFMQSVVLRATDLERRVFERVPTGITLHQKSRVLEIAFADGRTFRLPYEFLRVYSPSAEVRGHAPG